jgi:hypothetical protein
MSLAGMVHHNNSNNIRRMTVGSGSRSNSDRKSNASNGRPSAGSTGNKNGKGRKSSEFDNVMRINMTHNTPHMKESLSAQKRANSFLTSADRHYAPDDTIEIGKVRVNEFNVEANTVEN